MSQTKKVLEWRKPLCGGHEVNGSKDCSVDEKTGVETCNCVMKPKGFNYPLHYIIAQAVFLRKAHLSKHLSDWEVVTFHLFDSGGFKNYSPVQAQTIKTRFFDNMVSSVSQKHGIGEYATGFETHPEVTPYDDIMLKMIRAIEVADQAKAEKKSKEAEKRSTLLAIEDSILPSYGKAKPTEKIVNDDDETVDEGLHLDSSDDEAEGEVQSSEAGKKRKPTASDKQSQDKDRKKLKGTPITVKPDPFLAEMKALWSSGITPSTVEDSPETKELKSKHAKMKLRVELARMEDELEKRASAGTTSSSSSTEGQGLFGGMFR